MDINAVGNLAGQVRQTVRNRSTTVTIPKGAPVFFIMDGTNDGLDVQNANAAGAGAGQTFFAGILPKALPPGITGRAVILGVVTARVLTTATAIVKGDVFTVVTTAAADQITRSGAGAAMTVAVPNIVAAAADATAAATSINLKVYVRP